MQIQCPSCKKQYSIDGSKVTEQGVKIICPACKHQFIMRRKAEDKPKPKPEPQKVKTPPCAVCGAPSTHVFRGPPPRPLCEIHFKIESEKSSRFFEEDGGTTRIPSPTPAAPPPPPDRTSISAPPPPPDPSRTRVGAPAPARPAAPPPGVSQPSFDSFDDFDFSDLDSPGTSRPGTSRPGTSMPGLSSPGLSSPGFSDPGLSSPGFSDPGKTGIAPSPPPRPAAKPKPAAPEPAEGSFTASPFEFMEESASANVAPPEPPPPEPEESDDPFRPESASDSQPSKPAPDKSIPDFMPDPDEDLGMGFSPKKSGTNLDGSSVEEPAAPEPEDDFDFGWEDKPKAGTKLDAEMQAPRPAAPAGPVAPVVRPARAAAETVRMAKPRSPAISAAAAAIMLLAVVGAILISMTGWADQPPAPQETLELGPAEWVGKLQDPGYSSAPEVGALPTLEIEGGIQEPTALTAGENAKRAMQQALRDTPSAYASALAAIDAALASEPDNGEYQALKVDILAFREALAAGGQPNKAGASSQALAEATGQHPLLIRAKAHVFLNDQKTAAASALLNNYLSSNPQDGVAVFLLAMAIRYQPQPDKAEAARLLEKAITLEPGLVRGYWELARIYREQGQYKAAIDIYNRILTSFPDHEGTAEAMEETLREQQGVAPGATPPGGTSAPGTAPAITIIPQPAAAPVGISSTGNAISDNIIDAINEVEPRLRRVQPNLEAPRPVGQPTTAPARPQMPKPPEEAQ